MYGNFRELVIDRFLRNREGFWKDYSFYIIIFTLSVLCDAVSTIYVMLSQGPEAEFHPVFLYLAQHFGPIAGPLVGALGKVLASLLVGIYCRRFASYIFLLGTAISIFASIYNMIVTFHIFAILPT